MKKIENILICDICKKKVSDGGEMWVGGHPTSGWFKLTQLNGSTALSELMKKRDWNLCSPECLTKLIKKDFVIETPTEFVKGYTMNDFAEDLLN